MDTSIGYVNPQDGSGFYPYGFWQELSALFTLAWPTSLSILFHYLILPISLSFCGHLGKIELASVSMALSVIYVVMVSVGRGLAFGGDTFFAQTYGSNNKKNVGVYLQKGLIFGTLWTMPTIGILLNTENILLLIGQEAQIASLAQKYTQLFCPGAFAYSWLFMIMRYLLCQNQVIPNLIVCIVSCAINALLNYGLVYQADMGIEGSAIALMMTYYLVLIQFVSYILWSGACRETWGGWSWKCLEDWWEFFKVTTFSFGMTFVLWICTEVGTFFGGLLSLKQLTAFSISFQVEGFAWMIPLGIGGACSTRIGQFLGAKQPIGAKTTARVALTVTVLVSVVTAATTFLLRDYIPRIFTNNREITEYTSGILRVTAMFLLLEAFGGVLVGIVRGVGRQGFGTIVMVVSYFLFAWPVGIPLMFATSLGLYGLWWGFVLGAGVQDLCFGVFVATMSWEKESDKAQVRAGVVPLNENENSINRVCREEPDETTGLLTDRSNQQINASLPENMSPAETMPQLIFKRLLVVAIYVSFLITGIIVRIFVKVDPLWTSLCLPNGSANVVPNERISTYNTSLPLCTDTFAFINLL